MGDNEIKVTLYKIEPARITDLGWLAREDKRTLESIRQANELIRQAEAYRLKLYERCQKLESMDSHTRISLKRERRWKEKIVYCLQKTTVYSDGTEYIEETTKYEGRQRHEAIKAFNGLKKQYPMFEYVLDIDKTPYER